MVSEAQSETRFSEESPMISPSRFRAMTVVGLFQLLAIPVFAQHDPGVRGGMENTAGQLQFRGLPIPHPPVISPNPTTRADISPNQLVSSMDGSNRAAHLQS